ncbi:Beta [Escovopsis weberi]|uniref:Beta n=1 Tax=Escovopsis weberi TaxID=150374 RepID=A0A0M8N5Z8_ESCWE|nr:Beta [Escovopsis weberi]
MADKALGRLQNIQGHLVNEQKQEPEWPNSAGFQGRFEQLEPVDLEVRGTIPPYAAGTLYRTGPGAFQVEGTPVGTVSLSHWFDGFSQTHRFQLLPPASPWLPMRVVYNSRLHADGQVEDIRQTGSMKYFTFAQRYDPCSSLFKKVMSKFVPSIGEVNIGVTLSTNLPGIQSRPSPGSKPKKKQEKGEKEKREKESQKNGSSHASGIQSLWAKSDASMLKELDPETLEPIGIAQQSALHPDLRGPLAAAHARSDPVTGDVFNYNLSLDGGCVYRVFRTSAATGETEILATISGEGIRPAYLHSLFLTERFVILCIWNSHLAKGGAVMLETNNIFDAIDPAARTAKTKWLVVDRHHGRGVVAAFQGPSFFCFHSVNSYEVSADQNSDAGGDCDILCDVMQFENTDILHEFYYDVLLGKKKAAAAAATKRQSARYARYRLPGVPTSELSGTTRGDVLRRALETGEFPIIAPEEGSFPLHARGDLPTLNPAFVTRAHRYVYVVADRGLSTFFDGLFKLDTTTKEVVYWKNPRGHTPGEAVFVADPRGTEEDDGVLLSVVLDGHRGKSYLLCLDARSMRELGRAECPVPVHFGYHGQHIRARETTRAVDI